MAKKKIVALVFLTCCAPLLACADNAAHNRAKKAAEYRDARDSAEQPRQIEPTPGMEGKLPDTPRERQPANGKGPWNETTRQYRTPVDGMKTFYEPEAVTKDGDAVYFRMYSSHDPATREEGVEYSINCNTQEFTSKAGEWKPPTRVLPGERMYPIAKKLCEWGSGFGSGIKKLFD